VGIDSHGVKASRRRGKVRARMNCKRRAARTKSSVVVHAALHSLYCSDRPIRAIEPKTHVEKPSESRGITHPDVSDVKGERLGGIAVGGDKQMSVNPETFGERE